MNHDETSRHAFDRSHNLHARRAARQHRASADANPPATESAGHVVGEHDDPGRWPARRHMANPVADAFASESEQDHVWRDVIDLLGWRQPDPGDENLEPLLRVE